MQQQNSILEVFFVSDVCSLFSSHSQKAVTLALPVAQESKTTHL